MNNLNIARALVRAAHRLEREERNLFRVRAYRRAAETVLGLDRPLEEIVAESGERGLRRLPGIGCHLAKKLANLVRTGDFATLTADVVGRETASGCHT
jgi:DNA polymerase/3'-5' exonuclease PolX